MTFASKPYDPTLEAKACVNELFYRNGATPTPLALKDVAYVLEVITRYLTEAAEQPK